MALLAEICDISELETRLGVAASISDADRALLLQIKQKVEADLRRYCRHNITAPSSNYVHFLPTSDHRSHMLQLPHIFVTSIVELREDSSAKGCQNANDFAAGSMGPKVRAACALLRSPAGRSPGSRISAKVGP